MNETSTKLTHHDPEKVELHRETIEGAHPDWADVVASSEFNIWLDAHPLGEVYRRTLWPPVELESVIGGTAQEINYIITEFKNTMLNVMPQGVTIN